MTIHPYERRAAKPSFEKDTSEDSESNIEKNENVKEEVNKEYDDEINATSDVDCTKGLCEVQLADNFWYRYRINVPNGADIKKCDQCTITMEVIYDGESWVSIAFSEDGDMVGSEAVM